VSAAHRDDLDAARGIVNGTLMGTALWLLLLVGVRSLFAQVEPTVTITGGRAETVVRNPSHDAGTSVTIELLGPLPDLAPVRALVSPNAFTLGVGETQTVKLRLHESVAVGTVLRLRTCLTPLAPAAAPVATSAVARITLRTCIVAKAIVR